MLPDLEVERPNGMPSVENDYEDAPPGADVNGRIRVVVVVEHEIVRHGLVASLAADPTLSVAISDLDTPVDSETDIAVVSGEAARRIRFPCPIVVCSDPLASPRIAPGNEVAGILHGETLTAIQVRVTVHAVAAGLRVHPRLVNGSRLEPRARRVLELMAEGLSTREIADRMSYSERTIKKQITALGDFFEARNRAQLVAQAIHRGLI